MSAATEETKAAGAAVERIAARRTIGAAAARVFAVLTDPDGHVAIDSSGMLQSADGARVREAGDSFVVHMAREALGDIPEMGRYDVVVHITGFEPDRWIEWTIEGTIKPPIGHRYGYRLEPAGDRTEVTSYCDWSTAAEEWKPIFPVIDRAALQGTLGILDRTVRRGYPTCADESGRVTGSDLA